MTRRPAFLWIAGACPASTTVDGPELSDRMTSKNGEPPVFMIVGEIDSA